MRLPGRPTPGRSTTMKLDVGGAASAAPVHAGTDAPTITATAINARLMMFCSRLIAVTRRSTLTFGARPCNGDCRRTRLATGSTGKSP